MNLYYLPGSFKDGYKVDKNQSFLITRTRITNQYAIVSLPVYSEHWTWFRYPLFKGKLTPTETSVPKHIAFLEGDDTNSKTVLIPYQDDENFKETFFYQNPIERSVLEYLHPNFILRNIPTESNLLK